jgi:hypothetical protein
MRHSSQSPPWKSQLLNRFSSFSRITTFRPVIVITQMRRVFWLVEIEFWKIYVGIVYFSHFQNNPVMFDTEMILLLSVLTQDVVMTIISLANLRRLWDRHRHTYRAGHIFTIYKFISTFVTIIRSCVYSRGHSIVPSFKFIRASFTNNWLTFLSKLAVAQMVEELCWKSESSGLRSRWDNWIFFKLSNPSSSIIALGFTQSLTELCNKNRRLVRKSDSFTVICERTSQKTLESRYLTTP